MANFNFKQNADLRSEACVHFGNSNSNSKATALNKIKIAY